MRIAALWLRCALWWHLQYFHARTISRAPIDYNKKAEVFFVFGKDGRETREFKTLAAAREYVKRAKFEENLETDRWDYKEVK